MSRAFVKEDDGSRPELPIKRVPGEEPNYVTESGMQRLREALARAQAENDARNIAYFEERISSAIREDPQARGRDVVSFGSTVTVADAQGKETTIRIVGEDEADPANGALSWTSPYAQALLDHRTGEKVTVRRPAGAVVVVIKDVAAE
jgi:transcription elongation factor GreB